jgi:hypothetical protein
MPEGRTPRDQTLNRSARRLVYQSVTGWGGQRRAVRAGSRAEMSAAPNGDLSGIIVTPDSILAVNDETDAVDLFHG